MQAGQEEVPEPAHVGQAIQVAIHFLPFAHHFNKFIFFVVSYIYFNFVFKCLKINQVLRIFRSLTRLKMHQLQIKFSINLNFPC